MNEEKETDEVMDAFMPAFEREQEQLAHRTVPATLLDQDGHELSKGHASVSNPETLARFWASDGTDLDVLAGTAKTLLLESGRSLPVRDAAVDSSTGTRFLKFPV